MRQQRCNLPRAGARVLAAGDGWRDKVEWCMTMALRGGPASAPFFGSHSKVRGSNGARSRSARGSLGKSAQRGRGAARSAEPFVMRLTTMETP